MFGAQLYADTSLQDVMTSRSYIIQTAVYKNNSKYLRPNPLGPGCVQTIEGHTFMPYT